MAARNVIAPDESPDAEYPFILITGRQLEHWHTGSMTRRATVLDGLEPEANCSLHPKTLRKLGVEPGGMIQLTTRRGSVTVMARADRAVSEDNVFLPFAYVEAAANILTNAALDPYGKRGGWFSSRPPRLARAEARRPTLPPQLRLRQGARKSCQAAAQTR